MSEEIHININDWKAHGNAALDRILPNRAKEKTVKKKVDTTGMKVPCAVFSRVVGYLTAMGGWNKGKMQEERDRVYYK